VDEEVSPKGSLSPRKVGGEEGEKDSFRGHLDSSLKGSLSSTEVRGEGGGS
jgi:hypothetical protein